MQHFVLGDIHGCGEEFIALLEAIDRFHEPVDTHLVLINTTKRGIDGKPMARAMEQAGLVANYNNVPFDPRPPMDPSGVRLGTAVMTTRGMGEEEA